MEQRRRRKHRAHKRVLALANEHRGYLETTPGGSNTIGKLDSAVTDEGAEIVEQDRSRSDQQVAADRCQRGRKALNDGIKYIANVSPFVVPDDGQSTALDGSPAKRDEELIARVENIHKAASAHAELFVKEGIQPGFLDQLSNELTAFKKAKDALTLVGRRYTEANERLDQALEKGDKAVAVLESLFTNSADAPVGALTALQQAKLIGPRVAVAAPEPGATNPPPAAAAAPATLATLPTLATTTATASHEEHPAPEPAAPDKAA